MKRVGSLLLLLGFAVVVTAPTCNAQTTTVINACYQKGKGNPSPPGQGRQDRTRAPSVPGWPFAGDHGAAPKGTADGLPVHFSWRGRADGKLHEILANGLQGRRGPGKVLLYDFRRTAIRNMIRAGVPRNIAMKISGHRTESVFERYNIGTKQDIQEAILKTAAFVESLPGKSNVVPFTTGPEAEKDTDNSRTAG